MTRERKAQELEDAGDVELAADVRAGLCACGCKEQIHGGGERVFYVNERHKQRAYRRRVERAAAASGIPSRLSLKTLRAATPTPDRNADAQTAGERPQTRRTRKPSGPRPGVTVYFPTIELAELVLDAVQIKEPPEPTDAERRAAAITGDLWQLEQARREAAELTGAAEDALREAIARRRRRDA